MHLAPLQNVSQALPKRLGEGAELNPVTLKTHLHAEHPAMTRKSCSGTWPQWSNTPTLGLLFILFFFHFLTEAIPTCPHRRGDLWAKVCLLHGEAHSCLSPECPLFSKQLLCPKQSNQHSCQ